MRILSCFPAIVTGLLAAMPVHAEPGAAIHETCPSADEVGDNVECYPVTFTSKTEVHPDGIPIIGYLFVPKERPAEPLPAIVFAHGSGSMYSDGNHNKGLNSKHKQWVRQYTDEFGIVGLHVSSFHSRYLLPDTEGDQRILEIDQLPAGPVGGDDYRATSYLGYEENDDGNAQPYEYIAFDPEPEDSSEKWKDSGNRSAGVSEVMERAYDMDAAWDFLAGIRKGRSIENTVNDDEDAPTRGTPVAGVGYIGEIVAGGLVVDHERIFLYGTSHGGQTAMAAAHAPRALGDANPMNTDLPVNFERHRFAAFFDYYGGCGLYGAYNGADADSSWRPYGPFLMLHGENDDIWVEEKDDRLPTIREDWFDNGNCEDRIAAAKADPEFDQFLEAIVYASADHSFDGTERDDINSPDDSDLASWLAKIHANYRVTVPFMQAVGRIVSADRNDEQEVPALADFAFTPENLQFTTLPFDPWIPPGFSILGPAIEEAIEIPDLANHDLRLYDYVLDPAAIHPLTCEAINLSENVSLEDCVLKFRTTPDDNGNTMRILVSTPLGFTIVEATLNRTAQTLKFNVQGRQHPPPGHRFTANRNDDGTFRYDARSLASTDDRYWREGSNYTIRMNAHPADTNFPPDAAGFISGVSPVTDEPESLFAELHVYATVIDYVMRPVGDRSLEIECCTYNYFIAHGRSSTPVLPRTDFLTYFSPLPAVDDGEPLPPGGFPGDGDEEDSGDGNPGDDDSGNDEPGNDDNTGGPDPGNSDNGSNDGSGGGGALLWLIPLVSLSRRR